MKAQLDRNFVQGREGGKEAQAHPNLKAEG